MIEVPQSERPRASLVMVTWNAVEWSRRAIASIVDETQSPYELIIVDNASTDATRDFFRADLRGATIVLNDDNFGFGVAANLGAARAKAPVIVFVNSDVVVRAGWLEPLCLAIERDPDVAAAGPAIFDLEKRLDHAGALLAHDGWGMHYGRGEPMRAEYAFPRCVDYVSGACLAVRGRAFHDTGGFDPWFQTAYFEDADLGLRFTSLGWKVVYEPASVVTHAGGASGTAEGSLRLLAINHPRFYQRWSDLLKSRPEAPLTARPERILGARDAVASGTILLIGDGSGAARELARSIATIAPNVRITLVGEQLPVAENVDALSGDWLHTRRFHYDIVAGGEGTHESSIRATQPLARRLTLNEFRQSVESTLVSAGIA